VEEAWQSQQFVVAKPQILGDCERGESEQEKKKKRGEKEKAIGW
jgi:hypothetical protein